MQTKDEWKLVKAGISEIGLLHNGKPCRTWFRSQFGNQSIDLEHPLVKQAMVIQKAIEKTYATEKTGE